MNQERKLFRSDLENGWPEFSFSLIGASIDNQHYSFMCLVLWNVTKVAIHKLSASIFCYLILPLHHSSEATDEEGAASKNNTEHSFWKSEKCWI